tara:strand:- start:6216 stop:6695 length:480 start_codon:yes stop_codon:yes gene_type:complete
MDKTANYYDLLYLANGRSQTCNETNSTILNNDDLLFYKKRMLILTNRFINGGKSDDDDINEMFKLYAQMVIEHFKYNDTRDTIQQDYVKYNTKSCKTFKTNDLSGTIVETNNELIMRKKIVLAPKMTNHVVITNVKKKSFVIPRIRQINLKDNKFKDTK